MTVPLLAYLEGSTYQQDLRATHHLWSGSETLGTAGVFMFLSYLTIPLLTAVQPVASPSRIVSMKLGLESEREKRFLLRLLGLSQESGWGGGIRNVRVRDMAGQLARNHLRFVGMEQGFMTYFAGIIALSALRVHAIRGSYVQDVILAGYWSYMQHALSLLGVTLTTTAEVERDCERFIGKYSYADTVGRLLLETLVEVYPQYVDNALPVLFSQTRVVVTAMLEECHAKRS